MHGYKYLYILLSFFKSALCKVLAHVQVTCVFDGELYILLSFFKSALCKVLAHVQVTCVFDGELYYSSLI